MSGDKFNGKYRIASACIPDRDYSSTGPYGVTIYTKNRR